MKPAHSRRRSEQSTVAVDKFVGKLMQVLSKWRQTEVCNGLPHF
jgi:hypothetical protein